MRYSILVIILISLAGCGAQPVAPHACLIDSPNAFNCQAKQIGF